MEIARMIAMMAMMGMVMVMVRVIVTWPRLLEGPCWHRLSLRLHTRAAAASSCERTPNWS
eukprot:4777858-Pleurochrysis_carterae.AAC.2